MVQAHSISNKKLIVIIGPTGSGKSLLAVELSKRIGGEIISADAFQVYRRLNIGTAKIDTSKCSIPHHLIDVVDCDKEFSVSDYIKLADKAVSDIWSRGKYAVVCGGTGFFIKGLLFEQSFGGASKDDGIRQRLTSLVNQKGTAYLHDLLKAVDPESAKRIHENDIKRVIRALEIYEINGVTKSESMINDTNKQRYDFRIFQLNAPRQLLYDRINERVDKFIEQGLIEEVTDLRQYRNCQCMSAIGYKEFFDYFDGNATMADTIELIKKNTRNYAKRQITFFKGFPDAVLLNVDNTEANIERIKEFL